MSYEVLFLLIVSESVKNSTLSDLFLSIVSKKPEISVNCRLDFKFHQKFGIYAIYRNIINKISHDISPF